MSRKYHKVAPEPYWAPKETVCDLCKELCTEHKFGSYAKEEVTISARSGNIYPGADFTTIEEADVCFKCWTEKVKPALEAIGVVFYSFENGEGRTRNETAGMT